MNQSLSTYPDKQNYNYIININVIKPSAMISYNEKLIKFYIPRLPSLSIRNPAAITTAALLKESQQRHQTCQGNTWRAIHLYGHRADKYHLLLLVQFGLVVRH